MSKWETNGQSIGFDILDADFEERFEEALDLMKSAEDEVPRKGKNSVIIRAYCNIYRVFFGHLFGEEKCAGIFAGVPTSAAAYDEIYDSFTDCIIAAKNEHIKLREERFSKYKPKYKPKK